MCEPVADVGRKRCEDSVDHFLCAWWSVNMEWSFCLTHDVVRCDDVVEVGEVIAMKMGDQHTRQKDR